VSVRFCSACQSQDLQVLGLGHSVSEGVHKRENLKSFEMKFLLSKEDSHKFSLVLHLLRELKLSILKLLKSDSQTLIICFRSCVTLFSVANNTILQSGYFFKGGYLGLWFWRSKVKGLSLGWQSP
jgi:hypothetical protein